MPNANQERNSRIAVEDSSSTGRDQNEIGSFRRNDVTRERETQRQTQATYNIFFREATTIDRANMRVFKASLVLEAYTVLLMTLGPRSELFRLWAQLTEAISAFVMHHVRWIEVLSGKLVQTGHQGLAPFATHIFSFQWLISALPALYGVVQVWLDRDACRRAYRKSGLERPHWLLLLTLYLCFPLLLVFGQANNWDVAATPLAGSIWWLGYPLLGLAIWVPWLILFGGFWIAIASTGGRLD